MAEYINAHVCVEKKLVYTALYLFSIHMNVCVVLCVYINIHIPKEMNSPHKDM